MENSKILVCGAGIAGTTLAYWLKEYGFEPTLVEQGSATRDGGYIVDFWGRGLEVAEKMNLLPALRSKAYEIDEVRLVDDQGNRVGGLDTKVIRSLLGEHFLRILRGDLAKIIHESLEGRVRTILNDAVTGVAEEENGLQVTFENAEPERFDLVVGTGGLCSPINDFVFGRQQLFENHLGHYAASFSVEGYPRRDCRAFVSYSAPGRQISRYTLRNDRTVFLMVFSSRDRLPLGRDKQDEQKAILHQAFRHHLCDWECPAIFSALEQSSDLYFNAVGQIRKDRWSKGRVALLGNAGFWPSLLAGQGSALAMLEAYVLAGELKHSAGDYRLAFEVYENRLHPFILRKQRAAARFARSFAPRTRFGIRVRNQVTRLMTLPGVANLAMGRLLYDPFVLPTYADE